MLQKIIRNSQSLIFKHLLDTETDQPIKERAPFEPKINSRRRLMDFNS